MKVSEVKWLNEFCLLFFFLFSLAIANGPRCAYAAGDLEAMTQFANIHLSKILGNIPVGDEKEYGFENRDEFAKATLGLPYQEYDMDKEGATGYWRIPVTVDGKNRALLRLKKTSEGWKFSGFGGAELARELGDNEDSMIRKGSRPQIGRIIRDFSLQGDYVQYGQKPDSALSGALYPLKSASRVLLMLGTKDSAGNGGYDLDTIRLMRSKAKEMLGEPGLFNNSNRGVIE